MTKDSDSVLDDVGHLADNQSIILKNTPPCLDEIRLLNPQKAIDHLYNRKEMYKRNTKKQTQQVNLLNEKLKAANQKALHYRKKFKEELAMKKWWKYACLTVGTASAVLILFTLIVLQVASSFRSSQEHRIPTSAITQKSPASMLASVNILNGYKQGSGTVISQGASKALILSAGHNFKENPGSLFWVYFADGTFTTGTLLAVDHKRDLAIASIDADAVLGHSYVPEEIPQGNASGVGYTQGQGPNYRQLNYHSAFWDQKCTWAFTVQSGPFWDGDSGGGVFINNALIAVTTERNYRGNFLYACSHKDIRQFLKEHEAEIKDCGDYSSPPAIQVAAIDAPPLWAPKPNVPVFIENRLERSVNDLKVQIQEIQTKLKPVVKVSPQPEENLLKQPKPITTVSPQPEKHLLKRPSEVK